MSSTNHNNKRALPGRFEDLVRLMPPRAISDDIGYSNTLAMIDRLMMIDKVSRGQGIYMETLVQLVQVYEAAHYAIDTSDISGLESLRHILDENGMNASDLARILGVHASMGSKILKGERALTLDHVKLLSARFRVSPELFIDQADNIAGTKHRAAEVRARRPISRESGVRSSQERARRGRKAA